MNGKRNNAEVLINGKVYTIVGAEDSSYFQKVAAYMNHKLRELRGLPGFSKQKEDYQQLMLELNMADDYFKAQDSLDLMRRQKEETDRDIYGVKHELINTQMKLEEAQNRIQELEAALEEEKRGREAAVKEHAELAADEAARLNGEITALKESCAQEAAARKEAERRAEEAAKSAESARQSKEELKEEFRDLKLRYAAELAAREKAERNTRYAAEAVETAAKEIAQMDREIEELKARYAAREAAVTAVLPSGDNAAVVAEAGLPSKGEAVAAVETALPLEGETVAAVESAPSLRSEMVTVVESGPPLESEAVPPGTAALPLETMSPGEGGAVSTVAALPLEEAAVTTVAASFMETAAETAVPAMAAEEIHGTVAEEAGVETGAVPSAMTAGDTSAWAEEPEAEIVEEDEALFGEGHRDEEELSLLSDGINDGVSSADPAEERRREREEQEKLRAIQAARVATEQLFKSQSVQGKNHHGKRR